MTSTSSTSSIFDHTAGNRFFPELLGSTNKGANKIFEADQTSLRKIATDLAADKDFPSKVSDLVELFKEDAKGKTINEYFSSLSSYLSKAKTNLIKLFNFIKDNSNAFNIPDDVVAKIDNLLTINSLNDEIPEPAGC